MIGPTTIKGLPVVYGERTGVIGVISEQDAMRMRPNSATQCVEANCINRHALDSMVSKSRYYIRFPDRPGVYEEYLIPPGLPRRLRKANDAIDTEGFLGFFALAGGVEIKLCPLPPSQRRDYVPPNGGGYHVAPTPKPRPERRTARRPNLRMREILAAR